MTGPAGRDRIRIAAAIQDLSPGYFPFVMATSIISTGTFLLGLSWLSRVLLVITLTGLVVLSVALVIQLIFFRPDLAGVAAAVWLVTDLRGAGQPAARAIA